MASILSFLISFFFSFWVCFDDHYYTPALTVTPPPPPPPPSPITHYLLALQWPKTFCSLQANKRKTCNQPLPPSLTIHGLWPGNNSGKSVLDCDPQGIIKPFDSSKLNTIETPLAKDWPQLFQVPGKTTKEANEDFWLREWNKHGTCAPFKQFDFFDLTLEWFGRFDPTPDLLSRMNKGPTFKYNPQIVLSQLPSKLQKTIILVCGQDVKKNILLYEVRLNISAIGGTASPKLLPVTSGAQIIGDCSKGFLFPN